MKNLIKYLVFIVISLIVLSSSQQKTVNSAPYKTFLGSGWQTLFTFDLTNTTTLPVIVSTLGANYPVRFYWGDGTYSELSGTDDTDTKNYGSPVSYTVTVKAKSITALTKLQISQGTGTNVNFDLAVLPESLTYLSATVSNTISGDLADAPSGLTQLVLTGSNTVSGNLADAPSGLTRFLLYGSNTVYGDLADAPSGLTRLDLSGSNTIYGDLADAPSGLQYLVIYGSNTVSDYTSFPFGITYEVMNFTPVGAGGLSATEVDNLLIDFNSNITNWIGAKKITLTGTNAARTSNSDAAVSALQGKGVTVTTN